MDQRYIAALEIGSSKIKGAIATVDPYTKQVNVLAVATEPLVNSVRYGRVQNVQDVAIAANDIIRKLENTRDVAPRKVSHVFVSLGGRSFSTLSAVGELKLPTELQITADTIERLKREALDDIATNKRVVSIQPRRFFLANQEVKNVIGAFGQNIRGEFTAIVCSPESIVNLDRVRLNAGADDIARTYVPRILALADMATTKSERQIGCVVLDCGAETSTIAIFKEDTLRFISTLPLGGRNITLDLSRGLSITEDSAEQLKCAKASATPERSADATQSMIDNFVSARVGEIAANIQNQIKLAQFKTTDLPAGIILTGGCSRLPGFDDLLERQCNMKVTLARIDDIVVLSSRSIDPRTDLDIIALVRYAALTATTDCLTPLPEVEARIPDGSAGYPDEDDPDLLEDDPEDDIPSGGRRSSWRNKFKKKKKSAADQTRQPEPIYEDDPEEEGYEKEDDDEDDKPSSILQRLAGIGKTIFGAPDDEDVQ